jgi:hypothetical protein
MGEDMRGKSPTGEDHEKLRGEDCILAIGYFFGFFFGSLVLGFW